ncbi:MAG: DNA-3-methyladenine glycosylase [Actinobacteria bacterium]|nr:DNA-3-methyladenine glycosylase [Actinomycetota bacterium]MCZ6740045.1 DNA-3-methyladenine glycosylase [Actinomycetota bacterium]
MPADLAELLAGPPEVAAPRLLGAHLVSEIDTKTVRLRITDVEAYKGSDDPASHAFRGRTERNAAMFERPGTLYVYRSYGIHNCANTAAGPVGTGWGILIRGGEVIEGEGVVRARRRRSDELTNGPGKLCEALGISIDHNGSYLFDSTSSIRMEWGEPPEIILSTPRVGISKARERPWRFIAASAATSMG